MIYTTYDSISGQVLSTVTGSSDEIMSAHLSSRTYIPGNYNDKQHYIDVATNTPIVKPDRPSQHHVWHIVNKTWDLDNSLVASNIRTQRNQLLARIDRINPVWFASLNSAQQTELVMYRLQLLNVPQQAGFPNTIDWPIKPFWL
jgi:hypothetical protein